MKTVDNRVLSKILSKIHTGMTVTSGETTRLFKECLIKANENGGVELTEAGKLACHWPDHANYKGSLKNAVAPFLQALKKNPAHARNQINHYETEYGMSPADAIKAAAAEFYKAVRKTIGFMPNTPIHLAYRRFLASIPDESLNVTQEALRRLAPETPKPAMEPT